MNILTCRFAILLPTVPCRRAPKTHKNDPREPWKVYSRVLAVQVLCILDFVCRFSYVGSAFEELLLLLNPPNSKWVQIEAPGNSE